MNRAVKFTVIASLAISGAAFANKDRAAMFKDMDTNADGKISMEEHAVAAEKMFSAMDADKDGRVTADEMTAYKTTKGWKPEKAEMSSSEKISVLDENADGILTSSEHANGSKLMFGRLDLDKDGYLSKTEFNAGHAMKMHHKQS